MWLRDGSGLAVRLSQLEPVAEPILRPPYLELLTRREFGTNCHGQGCERPRLSYTFGPKVRFSCELVQEVISAFLDVSDPFVPTVGRCGFIGEVQGHGVSVGAEPNQGGDVIQIDIFANQLARSEAFLTSRDKLPVESDRMAGLPAVGW